MVVKEEDSELCYHPAHLNQEEKEKEVLNEGSLPSKSLPEGGLGHSP
jgi:hypothetical protein